MSPSSTLALAEPAASRGTGLPIRQNLAWTLAGNGVYMAAQWGVLVLAAKLGSPAVVGQLSLAFAIAAPVFLLANLRLRAVQATDFVGEYQLGDYLSLRLASTLVALIAVTAIGFSVGFKAPTAIVILAVAVAKSVESGSDLLYGFFQQREEMNRMAVSMILRGALSLAAVGFVLRINVSAAAAAIALAGSWGLVLLLLDLPAAQRTLHGTLRMRWRWPTLKQLTMACLPLGFSAMLMSFGANLPRYFVEKYFGESELGIFSAIAYLAIAGNCVVSALGDAASPRLSQFFFAGNQLAFERLLFRLLAGAALSGLFGVLVSAIAGRPLLRFLYRAEYAQSQALLVWLMAASGVAFLASILNCGLIAVRRFQAHLAALVLMTAATGAACWMLVPRFGMVGSAIAATVGYGIQALYAFSILTSAVRPGTERC